jgi:hypothetical protein
MIKKLCAIALLCAANAYAQTAPAPNLESWKPLQFLIGTWEAKTLGGSAGAAGSGTYSFRFELRNHLLARHTNSAACKGPADFDCEHGDLLYVYPEGPGQALKAIYFDNEGHVIHYDVSAPTPNTVIFLSESSQPGPQFRLSYELKGSTMFGKFQIRPPGQTEFKSYLEWSGDKRL